MDILLIDDERLVRLCTQSMLEEVLLRGDVHFHHAASAPQARAWIGEHGPPALGFVDYKMPKCSGIDLLLDVYAQCPDTVWVLLSGYDLSAEEENIRRCGVRFVLPKPAGTEDFQRVLRESGLCKEAGAC